LLSSVGGWQQCKHNPWAAQTLAAPLIMTNYTISNLNGTSVTNVLS